jgi:hypothetical protein
MGYYSGVRGVITMAEARFQQMMGVRVKLPSFSEPHTLQDFFEEVSYEDGCCTIDSYGKHYDLEYMIELLARFKEGDTADEVVYQGDSGIEDSGTFFVLPEKWAFVSVRYPIIDDVKESDWVKATTLDAEAKQEKFR